MWGEETSPDGLGDEFVEDECSVLRSGLPVGMFRFSCPSLFKLRCQPTTKVEGFATIAETTSHQACLRPAPESPAGNPDPADFDLH